MRPPLHDKGGTSCVCDCRGTCKGGSLVYFSLRVCVCLFYPLSVLSLVSPFFLLLHD